MIAVSASLAMTSSSAVQAPVGNGFTVTASDIAFILKQIKIAEEHSVTLSAADPCGTLVGPGPNQVPDRLTTYGLRTVDGSCNNLFPGREKFAAADVPFPRLTNPNFRDAEAAPPGFPPQASSSYKQKTGLVYDSEPRLVSNLIVDQTSTNPSAVQAAGFPVRTQRNPGVHPCTTEPDPTTTPPTPGVPADCVPAHQTLFIPNVTTDVGLSPPYNSLFTFFGQFFDHGVDQTVKGGGTVFVPLHADDPLVTVGPDGKAGTGDEVPPSQAFMVLTRAQNQPGPDGILGNADDIQNANNTDSPWVDQSQTYTSHASHQVFLREYANNTAGKPVSTGKLLGGLPANGTYPGSADGQDGISTWKSTKKQAAELLGLQLLDKDVTNIPMIATDPYGNFIPGSRGLPQYVTATGLVQGCLAADPSCTGPVPVPGNVKYFDTPFLTDIAHNADPSPQDTDHNPATAPVAPTPDGDSVASADFAAQPVGTYDDEMLNAHFTCGDGRCNENIALSTIHQVFHSEHDRLVGDIQNTLNNPANAALKAAFEAPHLFGSGTGTDVSFGTGGRLFQAARFVTEMEYQHLVFEEFARKVQPAVRPFHVYSPDINPAVEAEFAHAVYRFGHSMLNDEVARTNVDGVTGVKTDNSLPLLTAFLNPPEFFNGHAAGTLTPKQAAGSIVMGSADQVGNELDEFVVDTLRNNLLGLPLDLPTLNMTRARDAGVPRLNDLRRQIFGQTNDGQLTPYTDWSDFGQHLKHPESLINFVAAYGNHPSITAATTAAGKRAAAKLIVNPGPTDTPPADAADFMFGSGAYATPAGGLPTTGLEDVDLWIGGLAEVTNLFGGLLGSTFNYVFQNQLEKLQDGDRFYYLARTPGMNLRTQLEGNSFSELIERNTDGTSTLKADAFATADCKFELGNLSSPATAAGSTITGAGSVNDDSTTPDCNENLLLLRKTDGTYQYRAINSVDPSGINGQSVYNGTPGVDKVIGGNDNDTIWGNAGNDTIEGNGGDDVTLGGDGNDIMTDLGGADVQKGGPGNDAIDGGIGDDIPMGGDGQDFINGGANDNETFAGPGNDFVIAGQGADAVFGDGGDDWIQGGSGQDLLQGDHGAPFFDDPAQTAPGNDIFIGQVGENDYDAEGGDDLMAQNAAVDRNAGAGGFDWAFHQYDTVGADDDMEINNNLPGLPIQVVINRDRWQETEAVSGSAFNDKIKGTSVAPASLGGAGFSGCDALDPTGVARIAGLNRLVTTFPSQLAPIVDASPGKYCPLAGRGATDSAPQINGQGTVWGEGDILLGGAGSDEFTGRGANDIIDGDHALGVRISVRTDSANPATEIGSADLMEHQYLRDASGALTGPTLQAAVFAGTVDPGNLVAVREINMNPATTTATTSAAGDCTAAAPTNCDVAVFSAARATYTITNNANGSVTVDSNGGADGIDTLWNVEQLRFTDQTVGISLPTAPSAVTATAGNGQATVSFTPGAATVPPTSSFTITVRNAAGTAVGAPITGVTGSPRVVTGLTNGQSYTFTVKAVSSAGAGPDSALSNVVTPTAPPAVPGPVTGLSAARNGSGSVGLAWTPPAGTKTSYTVQVRDGLTGLVLLRTITGIPGTATGTTVTGLTGGTSYRFRVFALNASGTGPGVNVGPITALSVPNAPAITSVAQGAAGGALTATVNWSLPANGGSPITSYRVRIMRMSSGAATATEVSFTTQTVATTPRSLTVTLAPGNYRFRVVATNAVGTSLQSAQSANVVPR
jgi:Ca2+-binding RTX toxin-like protein